MINMIKVINVLDRILKRNGISPTRNTDTLVAARRICGYVFTILLSIQGPVLAQIPESRIEGLARKLDSIVSPISLAGVTLSAKVLHAEYNKTLYEHNPEVLVIPASITKLITSACALSKLGPSFSFNTIIYTDDHDLSDAVINGNLYIKGFGDPDLNSGDIVSIAEQISKMNIKQITGNIVADESFFDSDYYTLSGYYSGDTGPSYWPYINALALDKNKGKTDPALSAATLLASSLNSLHVELGGTIISGKTPKGAKEITKFSRPIFTVISSMNKESDNHSAITLFKAIGANLKSNAGSLKGGQEVIESFLTDIGVNRYAYEILEGSGLTRFNKVTADVFIKLLKSMYDDRFLFDYYLNSLSIAGKDGTLRNRMVGTEAEGNVYGKTGTLNGVSALAGYVIDRDSEILIFYIVMNGFGGKANRMRDAQDEFCVVLAGFSRKQ